MSRRKTSSPNMIFSAVLLAVFGVFLAGVMAWGYIVPETPVPTVPQTTQATVFPVHVETMPATVPPETTLPAFDARRVNFERLIDTQGGVDIELTDREASYLNQNYGWSLAGANHLDGEQSLAYSRIHYLESDFVRTAAQCSCRADGEVPDRVL